MSLLTFRNDRIERAAPTASNRFNVDLGIRTRGQSPQHIIGIRYIDIVINYDHVTSEVSACMTIGGNHAGLLCVTGLTLLYRNNRPQPRATGFVTPHSL